MNPVRLPRLFRVASFRFATLYVLVFAGSALLLGVVVFLQSRAALHQQIVARIETETSFLREEFSSGGLLRLRQLIATRGKGASALDYLLQDGQSRHLAGEMLAQANLKAGWTTINVPQAAEDAGEPELVKALVTDLGDGVRLAVGVDLGTIDNLEEAIVTAFLWTIGPAALLGIVGGILVSRAFLARVDAITRTADAIIAGDLSRRVPSPGTGDDLDRLAATLNTMLDRIGDLMESLRQLSTDVAHDLRTPLARLYQKLEGVQNTKGSLSDYRLANQAAMAAARQILDTFEALLRIAQVEGFSPRDAFEDIDFSAIAETVVDAYGPDAAEAGYILTGYIAHGVRLMGDRELLTQALANLVENALRHTPKGTQIKVLLGREPEGVSLSVADDGPGAAPSDLPRLKDRFYRADRSRSSSGNGLGLALVAAVVDLHGGSLNLSNEGPGLAASIHFPIKREARG